jgi:hypothetical protein
MYPKTKNTLFTKRTISIGIAFIIVALIAGIYFLFAPFPAGPSLDVSANVLNVPAGKEAASVAGSYANHTIGLKEAASVVGWSAYANAPVVVKEAASVVGWSAYANPPTVVKPTDTRPLRRR